MRASVFEALAGFEKPASAYDIADAMSKAQGRRVAANSVYRIWTCSWAPTWRGGSKARMPMSPMHIPTVCTTVSS